jgi:hypothetical protein
MSNRSLDENIKHIFKDAVRVSTLFEPHIDDDRGYRTGIVLPRATIIKGTFEMLYDEGRSTEPKLMYRTLEHYLNSREKFDVDEYKGVLITSIQLRNSYRRMERILTVEFMVDSIDVPQDHYFDRLHHRPIENIRVDMVVRRRESEPMVIEDHFDEGLFDV